jgi:hypothetical protein
MLLHLAEGVELSLLFVANMEEAIINLNGVHSVVLIQIFLQSSVRTHVGYMNYLKLLCSDGRLKEYLAFVNVVDRRQ